MAKDKLRKIKLRINRTNHRIQQPNLENKKREEKRYGSHDPPTARRSARPRRSKRRSQEDLPLPSEEVAEGQVVQEFQRGYKLGEQVLRPSKVTVSSGSVDSTDETASEA